MNPALPVIERLLQQAIRLKATDLHFIPSADTTHIYFRILGERKLQHSIPLAQYDLILTYFKFTAGMDIGESRKPQDGSIIHDFPGIGSYSLRLSTIPLPNHESLAIRILPQEEVLPLDQLFLFPNQFRKLEFHANQPAGMILITGPTGSGKTTTLYALLQSLMNESSFQVITLEDPVERKLDGIIQMQINELAGITYQSGLKAALRHDPDILMIGELRDEATAKFAFKASLTGHLVLTTLHAKNAAGTIERLFEMGISRQELLQSLLAVASIQLIHVHYKNITRRAAIMEILEGERLSRTIQMDRIDHSGEMYSFEHLRRKAYAFGFSPEAILKKKEKIT